MTIPVGYAQVSFIYTGTGCPTGAMVTCGLDIGTYPDDPTQAAQDATGLWATHVQAYLSDQVNHSSTLVKFGPDATGPSGEAAGSGIGGDASDSGYPGASFLVRKHTAAGGRAGRGRMFLPGVPEAAVGPDGVLDVGKVAQILGGIEDWGAAMSVALMPPVVLHQPGSPIVIPSPITGWSVSSQVATQRQRNRR